MDDQQIQELFSDKEFVDSLLGLETPEEVQETLAEKGLDLFFIQFFLSVQTCFYLLFDEFDFI